MIRRTILEWQHLPYGEAPDQIPEGAASGLAIAASASSFAGRGGDGVLEHGRKSLRARGIVGVLATPDAQLEILPKIDAPGENHTANDSVLRHRLVHMLGVALNLRIEEAGIARLGHQSDTLLEILIRLFSARLLNTVRNGMPRQYMGRSDDLPALRGRLNTKRQFSVLATHPERLACDFDELSADIPLNQVMKATVTHMSRLARASDNQRTLRELAFAYAGISDLTLAELNWDGITLDRTNQRWGDLLSLAKLLLGSRYQATSSGRTGGYALLFEMNLLFEEYVARILKMALAGTELRVSTQGGHRSCLYEGDVGRFRTKPDIIIRRGSEIVMIIDTKWKTMTPKIDDPKQGVSQGDVYQLMAYSQLYNCRKTMLLYPHHSGLGNEAERHTYDIAVPDSRNTLTLSTVDVAAKARLCTIELGQLVRSSLGGIVPARA